MSFREKFGDELGEATPELEQALTNFRMSVHAWSEAEYGRVRPAVKAARKRSWRLATGWALGCALLAGGVGGAVYMRHGQELKLAAAERLAEQRNAARELQAREAKEDQLLAKVDSDVSREVPSAMEPLAQLMSEDETQ